MATITGTSGNDVLSGTAANDIIDGKGGIDTIDAGAGADIVRFTVAPPLGNTQQSLVDGGADHDILDLSGIGGTLAVLISDEGRVQAGIIGTEANFFRFTEMVDARNFEEIHLGPDGGDVEIDPGPAVEGNSESIDAPPLPTAWVSIPRPVRNESRAAFHQMLELILVISR